MLIVFLDIRGIVRCEFVPQGQTVNTKFYYEVLWLLRENIQRKGLDLWRAKNWILHNNSVTCHQALLVREFLASHNMLSLPHPLYSPDLAPADFFLFPKMKMQLKVCCFHTVAEIQRKSQDYHTRDHRNADITTPDVNTAMSLGTLPYQD
jgi:histone-lysine N-methyltransferase SETMAR